MAESPLHRSNPLLGQQSPNIAADLLEAAAQASAAQDLSGDSGDDVADNSPDGDHRLEKRKKRSRACQSCRQMKIRCNPVEGQDSCLACSKVNRSCVMPGPARKRQKTVHKVAELEKKINALTQSLLAKTQGDPTPPQQSPVVTEDSRTTIEPTKDSPKASSSCPFLPKQETPIAQMKAVDPTYQDVIDKGIISFAVADRVFDSFLQGMNGLLPLIAFPPGTTFESVRRTRPFLCLAILSAGCVSINPEAHVELAEELAQQLARRVFFLFEKSLDLIQACLIQTSWVGKHPHAVEVGFNQYIHAAIVMAHDLGLSKRLKTPLTKDPVEEAELRRTWLACYWCGTCVSVTLRYPPMVRNSPYIEECLEFFAKSPAALKSDQALCAFIRAIQILEDVAACFHMDDPASTIRMEDSSTQYSLKVFERRLEEWRKDFQNALQPGMYELMHATCSLYIHEIALHNDHNIDDFRPGRPEPNDDASYLKDFLTPAHINALTKCVTAMKSVLDNFIALSSQPTIRTLPCLTIVWTAYSCVAMIRLDGALRASNSKYADIFLPELRIDYYLDQLIGLLSRIAGPDLTCAPTAMFVQAFKKLKLWHQYRLAGATSTAPLEATDYEDGMYNVCKRLDVLEDGNEKGTSGEPATTATSTTTDTQRANDVSKQPPRRRFQPPYQQGPNTLNPSGIHNMQGFDTQGASWLSNSNMPIDATMFENQDWNFTLEDWNNFEASMVQPAEGTWLGYLL